MLVPRQPQFPRSGVGGGFQVGGGKSLGPAAGTASALPGSHYHLVPLCDLGKVTSLLWPLRSQL